MAHLGWANYERGQILAKKKVGYVSIAKETKVAPISRSNQNKANWKLNTTCLGKE